LRVGLRGAHGVSMRTGGTTQVPGLRMRHLTFWL
jgi:hypothetical protein